MLSSPPTTMARGDGGAQGARADRYGGGLGGETPTGTEVFPGMMQDGCESDAGSERSDSSAFSTADGGTSQGSGAGSWHGVDRMCYAPPNRNAAGRARCVMADTMAGRQLLMTVDTGAGFGAAAWLGGLVYGGGVVAPDGGVIMTNMARTAPRGRMTARAWPEDEVAGSDHGEDDGTASDVPSLTSMSSGERQRVYGIEMTRGSGTETDTSEMSDAD